MKNVLVVYASRHGSTKEIAERIALRLSDHGHEVTSVPIEDDPTPSGFDAIVLGSAIYMGHWLKSARHYLDEHVVELAQRPLYIFSSGPVVEDDEAHEPTEVAKLIATLGPIEHVLFGGKLDTHQLTFGEKLVVKLVGGHDGDLRSFEMIDEWADAVAHALG